MAAAAEAKRTALRSPMPSASARTKAPCQVSPAPSVSTASTLNAGAWTTALTNQSGDARTITQSGSAATVTYAGSTSAQGVKNFTLTETYSPVYDYAGLPVYMRLNLGTEMNETYRIQGSKGVIELTGNTLAYTPQPGEAMEPSY